jgi:hypothetical protein
MIDVKLGQLAIDERAARNIPIELGVASVDVRRFPRWGARESIYSALNERPHDKDRVTEWVEHREGT